MKPLRRQRRLKLLKAAERIAIALVLLDALFYFAANRPLHSKLARTTNSYTTTRLDILRRRARLDDLEKVKAGLPASDAALKEFLEQHIPPRRTGSSQAMRLFAQFAREADLQMTSISYKLAKDTQAPLDELGIQVNVEGTFPQVLKFMHEVETAKDFLLVRSFSVRVGANSALSLQLATDLFLTQ